MVPEEAGRRPYALLTKALEESEYVAIANSPCTTANTPFSCARIKVG